MEKYIEYIHNPPHLFKPNAKYFITSSTLDRYPYLKTDSAKDAALNYLTKSLEHYEWKLEDWVILDNHIHIMTSAPTKAETLSKVMKNFHRFTANWLSKNNVKKVKEKYFHNYWDTCITYENSYYARINYIWFNPVKHEYVSSPEKWRYGSYYYRYQADEKETKEIMKRYPFDKIKIDDDF